MIHARRRRSIFGIVAMLTATAFFAAARAQPQPASTDQARNPQTPAAATQLDTDRLQNLSPDRPELYLELGEDLLASAASANELQLARRVLVLAVSADRARTPRGGSARIASGACLALASAAAQEAERRWLISLASILDPQSQPPSWVQAADEPSRGLTGYLAAAAVGLVRSGDGITARRYFDEPGVRDLLVRYERLLSATGESGGTRALEREAQRWPCPECRNARIVKRGGSNPPQYKLCPVCGGDPGPKFSPGDLVRQLRLESRLLRGIQRSWGAQVAADGGSVLRDIDPDELAGAYGVDVTKLLYRDGTWVAVLPAASPSTPNLAPPLPREPQDFGTEPATDSAPDDGASSTPPKVPGAGR